MTLFLLGFLACAVLDLATLLIFRDTFRRVL